MGDISLRQLQWVKFFLLCIQNHVFNMSFENVRERHSNIPLQAVAKHQTPLIPGSIVCFTMKVYTHMCMDGCRLAHLGKRCYSICVAYMLTLSDLLHEVQICIFEYWEEFLRCPNPVLTQYSLHYSRDCRRCEGFLFAFPSGGAWGWVGGLR